MCSRAFAMGHSLRLVDALFARFIHRGGIFRFKGVLGSSGIAGKSVCRHTDKGRKRLRESYRAACSAAWKGHFLRRRRASAENTVKFGLFWREVCTLSAVCVCEISVPFIVEGMYIENCSFISLKLDQWNFHYLFQ